MKKSLKEGGEYSMIRIGLFIVVALAGLLALTMTSYIVVAICMTAALDWGGMALFLTALAGFMAPAFAGKAIQKKHEKRKDGI